MKPVESMSQRVDGLVVGRSSGIGVRLACAAGTTKYSAMLPSIWIVYL
jgi:hypothetical protein